MARTHFQVFRGDEAGMPALEAGEPAYALDSHRLWIGDGTVAVALWAKDDLDGVYAPAAHIQPLAFGGTGNDLSVRGPGYLKQTATGGVVDVGPISADEIQTGVLGAAYGGTGLVGTGPAGNVLTSNGTTWYSAAASGLTVPTGTGFRHVTAGSEDIAAALVTDADVAATAAIAWSKVSKAGAVASDVGADASGSAATVATNLATHAGLTTAAHGGIVASTDARLTDSRTPLAHQFDGSLHTVSGLTAGQFLKATGAGTFAFGAHGLTYTDVGADASGAAATVDGNLSTHAGLTTAHGSTSANTASTIVQRDANGKFKAGAMVPSAAYVTISDGLNSNIAITTGSIEIDGATTNFAIGGFSFASGTQDDGQILYVVKRQPLQLSIVNEDASSTATNRILTLTGSNVVLGPTAGNMMMFVYNGYQQRWFLLGTSATNPLLYGSSILAIAAGNNNDVVLADGNLQYVAGATGNATITGIAGGVDGREIVIVKGFWPDLSFTHNDASSAAGNRILCPLFSTLTLTGNSYFQTVTLVWTSTLGGWIVKSHT